MIFYICVKCVLKYWTKRFEIFSLISVKLKLMKNINKSFPDKWSLFLAEVTYNKEGLTCQM